jgi:hypothetical protein
MTKVKNFERRGDFVFRDVYKRHGFATFSPDAVGEESTYAVDAEGAVAPVHCAAHITAYDSGNGVASYHVFTRNGADFDKTQTAAATLSVDPGSVDIRAVNSTCHGSFTVGAKAFCVDAAGARAGVNTPAGPEYTLDVGGDCNLLGSLRVDGDAVIRRTAEGNLVVAAFDGLTIQADLVAGDNVLRVNALTGRVGVNVDAPARALDVAGDAAVSGNLLVGGYELASSVVHESTEPFPYEGPGPQGDTGLPFFQAVQTRGTPFVTPSGTNNSVFAFAAAGAYMLQVELEVGYPWLPEGDVATYFVKNGNTAQKLGYECRPAGATFGSTRPYLLVANAQDTIRFVLESTSVSEFQVGIQACRATFVKL